jgi:hypothetical protein
VRPTSAYAAALVVCAALAAPSIAKAEEQVVSTPPSTVAPTDPPDPDVAGASDQPPTTAPRAWLYVDDAAIPAQFHAVLGTRATLTSARSTSVTRPFASNLAAPGALFEIGGEVGVLPTVALAATGVTGADASLGAGMTAGVRIAPLAQRKSPFGLVVSGGFLRELGTANGFFGRVAGTFDVARLRLGTTLHAERVLAAGRDAVDVLVMAGASYRVFGPLRAGVEYVAQDLEGFFDPEEAEGGVRHFVGPTASLALAEERLSIVVGPALGLTYATPQLVGRAGIAYAF